MCSYELDFVTITTSMEANHGPVCNLLKCDVEKKTFCTFIHFGFFNKGGVDVRIFN